MSPSAKARELVRGAYDLHVHVAPDLIPRRIGDVELAQRFKAVGLKGFVLKSHYFPTAERAALVRGLVPEVRVLGAVVLNRALGGINPLAVELSARAGARVVWMPTVDAENEIRRLQNLPPEKQPQWARLQVTLQAHLSLPPIPVLGLDGQVLPEVRTVFQLVARHNLVLATGHLGPEEILKVAEAAWAEGVRWLVITHPDYPTQGLPLAEQKYLAQRGAFLERCLAPILTGKVSWEQTFTAIQETGVEKNVLSSDLGQPHNPPVEEGLALFADRLLEAGFSEEDVYRMVVLNTCLLAEGRA